MMSRVRRFVTRLHALPRLLPVRCVASAKLPTEYGVFDIYAFKNVLPGETHVALVRGDIGNGENVMTLDQEGRGNRAGMRILRLLGVKTMRLLSSHPRKLAGVTGEGLSVSERLPIEIPPTASSERYLRTKKERLGHLLSSV